MKDGDQIVGTVPDTEDNASEDSTAAGAIAKRVTVNLRQSDLEILEELAKKGDLRPNEVFRQAIATEEWIQRKRDEGFKLLVEDPDGNIREIEFR